ncbi:MAG: vitamin B12 dependent-methionine synthase activation domain-containing protein [Christensenellales bacterium]|jgi:hypothetical protein
MMDVYAEALRYMGVRGEATDEIKALVERAMLWVKDVARPKNTLVRADIAVEPGAVSAFGRRFASRDLAAHLEGCREAVFLAATLGMPLERAMRSLQRQDMALSVAADACATALIESVADGICARLQREERESGHFLTARFSVGYGDWDLSDQKHLIAVTDATRRIGVYLTTGGMMMPQKSVTAVMGISEEPLRDREFTLCDRTCETCALSRRCMYRSEK